MVNKVTGNVADHASSRPERTLSQEKKIQNFQAAGKRVQLTLFPVDKPRGGMAVAWNNSRGCHTTWIRRTLKELPSFQEPGGPYMTCAYIGPMQPPSSRALLLALARSPDMKPKRNTV